MPRSYFVQGYREIIDVLVAARRSAGLTQQQLSSQLGKPQSYVAKIERGERRLDILEFCQLVRVLGEKPSDILSRIEAEFPVASRRSST